MARGHKKSKLLEWAFHEFGPAYDVRSVERKMTVTAVTLAVLTPREGWVLRMYDIQGIPLSAQAEKCGVSREILARLHRSACRRLDHEYEFVTKTTRTIREIWEKYLPGSKPWGQREQRRRKT